MKNIRYIFYKWLLCLLIEIPAAAIAALVLLIGGTKPASLLSATDWAGGFLFPVLAAAVGMLSFFAMAGGIFKKLKLGGMSCGTFVLLESCAYALLLLLTVLSMRLGFLELFFLPQAVFTLLLGRFAIALNIPLYAILAAVMYRVNRKNEKKRNNTAAAEPIEEKPSCES